MTGSSEAASVDRVLAQQAQSLTDLALGLVTIALALRLPARVHKHWRTAFWWFGIAALAGAVHHGFIVRSQQAGDISWAIISVMVVVAVSYMLAATVVEILGPGRSRAFWALRSVGLIAYLVLAASGHAGVGAILACESLTMASILVLWGWAAYRRHPMAPAVIAAMVASGAAAAIKALPEHTGGGIGLDRTALYHLAQIPGMFLLFVAVSGPAWIALLRPGRLCLSAPRPARARSRRA
jgi:hypothetical protein